MTQNRKQSVLGLNRKQTKKSTLYELREKGRLGQRLGGIVGFISFLFITFH